MKLRHNILLLILLSILVYDSTSAQDKVNYLIDTKSSVKKAEFDENNQFLFIVTENHEIQLWDFRNAKLLRIFEGPKEAINTIAVSLDGKLVACGGREKKIFIWEVETGILLKQILGSSRIISSLAFNSLSTEIYSGSLDNQLNRWDWKNEVLLNSVTMTAPINKIEYNKTDNTLICGLFDGVIQVLDKELNFIQNDIKSDKLLSTFTSFQDGKFLVISSCSDGTSSNSCISHSLNLWDLKSAKLLHRTAGHKRAFKDLKLSFNESELFALDLDGNVVKYNIGNSELIEDSSFYNSDKKFSAIFNASNRFTMFGVNTLGQVISLTQNKQELIKQLVEMKINDWQKKGKFEKTEDYRNRVNVETRNIKVQEFVAETINELAGNIVNIDFKSATNEYDADNEVYKLMFKHLPPLFIKVPIDEAIEFDQKFNELESKSAQFVLKDDENFALVYLVIKNPANHQEYVYDSRTELSFFTSNLQLNFENIDIGIIPQNIGSNTRESVKTIDVGKSEIDINLPLSSKINPDAIAVVIGNRDYQKTSKVDYALNDARSVKEYLTGVMGFKEGNIIYEENATKGIFEIIFGSKDNKRGKLSNYVINDISDVFVYYSGHGAPDLKNQRGYFVPIEADPNYIDISGYSLDLFYSNISHIPAKSITVVLDACFSGANVYKNISPVTITMDSPELVDPRVIVMSSSSGTEVSSWFEENQHGLFTYYFLKAIHNKNADKNNDNKLTIAEIYEYLTNSQDGVNYNARRKGIEQNPTLTGNEINRVLIEW